MPRHLILVLAASWLASTAPMSAQTSWVDPGSDDWYDVVNWSVGVPSSTDSTLVNNGGTAVADRSSVMFTTEPTALDLSVGLRTDPMLAPPVATGAVELFDVDLVLDSFLNVGVVDTAGGMFNAAFGELTSTAGGSADGSLSVGGDAAIGVHLAGPAGAMAAGVVDLSGDFAGTMTGELIVGQCAGDGNANGALSVAGPISGFGHTVVGRALLMSVGDAVGWLTAGGPLTAGDVGLSQGLSVGSQAGDGVVSGAAGVDGGISGFETVLVGTGSTAGAPGASGTGMLTVLAGGIQVADGDSLSVGGTNGAGDVDGTVNVAGGISGYGVVDVGHIRLQGATGNAGGLLAVTGGGLTGTMTGELIVGQCAGDGNANGALSVVGPISGFGDAVIGLTDLLSAGDAVGELTAGGTLTAGDVGLLQALYIGVQAGDGVASGAAEFGGGISGFEIVLVGTGSTAGAPGASGTGMLTVLAGGIQVADGDSLSVGGTNGAGDVDGTASVAGGISGYGVVDVGHIRLQGTTGNASGLLAVTGGGLTGTMTGELIVGRNAGDGNANGALSVVGAISGFSTVTVGRAETDSSGLATGVLFQDTGATTATAMIVGVSEGSGTADGTVELNEAFVGLDDTLTLGTGSHLILHVDGLARGLQYGAIDASTAALDGTLDVLFEFEPPSGIVTFDLIRALDNASAIAGDFGLGGVTVSGLPPAFTVSTDIVVDLVDGEPAAIYRVTVISEGGSGGVIEVPAMGLPGMIVMLMWIAALGALRLRRL